MDISTWAAWATVLGTAATITPLGYKAVKWIRRRWPREVEPGVWDVGPGSTEEAQEHFEGRGVGRRRRPGLAYRASADEIAETLLHLAQTWRPEDVDELQKQAAQNRGGGQ